MEYDKLQDEFIFKTVRCYYLLMQKTKHAEIRKFVTTHIMLILSSCAFALVITTHDVLFRSALIRTEHGQRLIFNLPGLVNLTCLSQ